MGWRALAVITAGLSAAPAAAQPSGVCVRLESQLAMHQPSPAQAGRLDTTGPDNAVARLQSGLRHLQSEARSAGCSARGTGARQQADAGQCNAIDRQLRTMENGLRRLMAERETLRPATRRSDERTRRMLLAALAENDCGPQYARFAASRDNDTFLRDFSADPYTRTAPGPWISGLGGTFRTICVRTCDGYFWPVSFRTVQARFTEDARTCRSACPGSETALYVHRNPGEDIEQAVSLDGSPYTALPNALRYRSEFVEGCGCRAPGTETAATPRSAEPAEQASTDEAHSGPLPPGRGPVRRVGPEFPVYR